MSFRLTPEAAASPRRTIHAAEILHDNARSIAAVCHEAEADELIVAVVTRDMAFSGVWTVPAAELAQRLPEVSNGGWSMVFSPLTTADEVEDRAVKVARLAFARWEALRRWSSRHT